MGGAAPTIPAAPTALVATALGPDSVKVSWTDNATDETGYYVYWSTTATKPATPNSVIAAGINNATAAGLTMGTPYTFWVEAYNAAGSSAAITGTATPVAVPAAPTGLVVTSSATQLTLTWTDAATDETGYRVFISTTNTQPATAAHELAAGIQTYAFPASEIVPYTPYYVWVSAYNAVGNSAPATGSGTAGSVPVAPAGVAVDTTDPFALTANWTDMSDNETGFNVYWSTDDTKPATPGATVGPNIATYKATQVFGAQTYRFWVEAVNSLGKSGATKGIAAVPTTDVVWNELWLDTNGVHLAVADTYGVTADPDAATNIYGYQSDSGAAPANIVTLTPVWFVWNTANYNIDITKPHYFWVEVRKAAGSLFSLRTLAPGADTVANLAIDSINDVGAKLTWTASPGYTGGYRVSFGTGTVSNATFGTVTLDPTATVTNQLLPGTQYKFFVQTTSTGIGGVGAPYNGFPNVAAQVIGTTTGLPLGANLTLNKSAFSSTGDAAKAVDGNLGTRWESDFLDNQWIYVDLGAEKEIGYAKLVWEGAYSKSFEIQVCPATCDDTAGVLPKDWAWQSAYADDRTLAGFPYTEVVKFPAPLTGQFVRMLGKTRGTQYGHSLWEFEAYSTPVAP